MGAARRWAPRDESKEQVEDNGKRLPDGVAGALMGMLMVVIAVGGFYLLRGANHLWAASEPGSLLTLYETPVIWFFLPGFACLDWPWLMGFCFFADSGINGRPHRLCSKETRRWVLTARKSCAGSTGF